MAQFHIGTFSFTSKGAAKKALADMLKKYPVGSVAKSADKELLLALVNEHPWRANMLRGGIQHFEVFNHKLYRRQKFWKIVRPDGSTVDIAVTRFFQLENKDKPANFRSRARQGIKPQLDQFRRDCFAHTAVLQCPITGGLFTIGESHVDHIVSFETLVQTWEEQTNNDYSAKSLKDFVSWHYQVASLRCVSAEGNLSRGRET